MLSASPDQSQWDMFSPILKSFIDPKHPLVQLADTVDWTSLETEFDLRGSWQPWGKNEQELSFAAGVYRQPIADITEKWDAGFTAWMPYP